MQVKNPVFDRGQGTAGNEFEICNKVRGPEASSVTGCGAFPIRSEAGVKTCPVNAMAHTPPARNARPDAMLTVGRAESKQSVTDFFGFHDSPVLFSV
jgi:hypothetical protein